MKFEELLHIVGGEPVFETGFLLSGNVDPGDVRKQLSRWVRSGKILQLRRGLYILGSAYGKSVPHPFLLANRLSPSSYVSCQTALAHHSLIPEYTPLVISVSGGRPGEWNTPMGRFQCRHIKTNLLLGYEDVDLGEGQRAFVATPGKALLDLVHLSPGGDKKEFLEGLRLQNLDRIDPGDLTGLAEKTKSPRLIRAAARIMEMIGDEQEEYESL